MLERFYNHLEKFSDKYNEAQIVSIAAIEGFIILNLFINTFFGIYFNTFGALYMSRINFCSAVLYAIALYLISFKEKVIISCYIGISILCYYIISSTYLFGSEINSVILISPLILAIYSIMPFNLKHKIFMTFMVMLSYFSTYYFRHNNVAIYDGQYNFLEFVNVTLLLFCTIFITYTEKLGRKFLDTYSRKKVDQLKTELNTDFLTGLWNRRFMESEFNRKHTYVNTFIVIADIDFFKEVNDTYGHNAGDIVIKEVSNILKQYFNKKHIVCRWGGEEFLILARDITKSDINKKLEIVRRTVQNYQFNIDENNFNVTLSFGFTKIGNKEDITNEIEYADKALYHAKNSGRNRVVNYDTIK